MAKVTRVLVYPTVPRRCSVPKNDWRVRQHRESNWLTQV